MSINKPSPIIKKKDQGREHQITAGGGVVFRLMNNNPEVLLIHRRNLWDLPKGKLDKGESIAHCAAREVSEETGASLPMIIKKLIDTRHHYEEAGRMIDKVTHWFIMLTLSKSFNPQLEEDIDEICWVPLDEAVKLVGYDNLRLVLHKFKECM